MVGWGLLVLGVIALAGAVLGAVVLATSGALIPIASEGPVGTDVAAAAAVEQGLLTAMAAVTSGALIFAALGLLRSGRDSACRPVLWVTLAPSAVVAAAGGLWVVTLAGVALLAAVELLLRPAR